MSFTHHPPRDPITSAIRSRYPEIQTARYSYPIQPIPEDMGNIRVDNVILKKRIHEEFDHEERNMLHERLAISEHENRKLHDRLVKYKSTLEDLERTHMQLIHIVKSEQQRNQQQVNNAHQTRSFNNKSSSLNSTHKKLDFQDGVIENSFQGQYLISLKKVRNNQGRKQSQSPQQKRDSLFQSTHKKPGVNISYQSSNKKVVNNNFPKNNPQQNSQQKPSQKIVDQSLVLQLQKAQKRIKQLQQQLEEKSKQKANAKTISSENQLLKMKMKNIEEDIKYYQKSIQQYQVQVSQLQKIVNDLKQKQATQSISQRQVASIKSSNDSLNKQLQSLYADLEHQRQLNRVIKDDIEAEKKKNFILSQQTHELIILTNQLQRYKQSNTILNEQLKVKSIQISSLLSKQNQNEYLSRQILQIKHLLESVDLSSVEQQQKKIILEYRTKNVQLTHEVTVLSLQLDRFKQQILLLQQKITTLQSNKQFITSSLQQSQKQNQVLLDQIRNLQASIDKYLQEDNLPSIKITIDGENTQQTNEKMINEAKQSIGEVVIRLQTLEQRLTHNN